MKKYFYMIIIACLFSSCGTICGGRMYHAHVRVKGSETATISFGGKVMGHGDAVFKIPRFMSNNVVFTVQEDGCEEQKFNFNKRKFRGWAFAGSVTNWWLLINGIPVFPVGLFVDLGNSVFWKPDDTEPYVTRTNFRHYNYLLNYKNCKGGDIIQDDLSKVKVVDGPYLEHK